MKMTNEESAKLKATLYSAYDALTAKGYDPISQLIGFLRFDDPTYLTTYKDTRNALARAGVDELMEEVLTSYFSQKDS